MPFFLLHENGRRMPTAETVEELAAEVEAARHGRTSPTPRTRPRRPRRWGWTVVGLILLALLPFLGLVRGAVALYASYGIHTWLAVTGGLLLTTVLAVLITGLLTWRWRHVRFGRWVRRWLFRSIAVAVLLYGSLALATISAQHVKTPDLQETYTSLHPLLRLSLGTLVWLDADLVITDGLRTREDYGRMGLPVYERSLHLTQSTGYVHAVDLRTNGRSEFRNTLVATYFSAMGFRTLRHVGTADHLHVSLPVP